jgi:hypothetical protein
MTFRRLRLRVETPAHVVEGILQLPTEGYRSRTTDYLNAHDTDFIALVDARVQPLDGGDATEHEYVALNLRHAVLVLELEQLGVTTEPLGPLVASIAPVEVPAPEPDPASPPSVPPPGAA